MKHFGHTQFKVTINGKDVSDGVTQVKVFADITNPCWSATITFIDSVDLINKLPIKKKDKVKIVLETGNILDKQTKEFNFSVYKIGDKFHLNQKSVGYTLYTVSEPLNTNLTKTVSRHLVGEPTGLISDMFNEFFSGYTCDSSGSNGQVNMTASAWTPFNTFGQLLKTSHKNNIADYLFFQNSDTTFTVKSITDMYSDLTGIKFKYKPNATGDAIDYPYLITKYEVEHFDGSFNLSAGFYGSNVFSYDFTNKTFGKQEYTNSEDSSKLNDGESYDNQANAHNIFQPMHHGITDGSSQVNSFNTWLPSRHASLLKLEQEKLLIQVSANMEYIDNIGKSCMVEIPNQDYFATETLDTKRSGKHLITALCFVFNKEMFVCNLELVKREFEG